MLLDPLERIQIPPRIAALPKADLHVHQEDLARFERVAAEQNRRAAFDPRPWIRRMMAETPPGMGRINHIYSPDAAFDFHGMKEDDPAHITAKMAGAMLEAAGDGAILVEIRFGAGSTAFAHPEFMALFREAERRVQALHPGFCAEADIFLAIRDEPLYLQTVERQMADCIRLARDGLAGVDLRIDPYDAEAGPEVWKTAYRLAERAAEANLAVTVHAGEFSAANLLAALRTPGLRRLGHAVYAASDPRILTALAQSGVTVECSLTSNVVLGAVPMYEAHPILQFVDSGIPVTLATDLPVHLATTIGREYAIAATMGFSTAELVGFTRNAVRASFTTEDRKKQLLETIQRCKE